MKNGGACCAVAGISTVLFFNQPFVGVVWLTSLRPSCGLDLTSTNQPIPRFVWSASLQHMYRLGASSTSPAPQSCGQLSSQNKNYRTAGTIFRIWLVDLLCRIAPINILVPRADVVGRRFRGGQGQHAECIYIHKFETLMLGSSCRFSAKREAHVQRDT